MPEFPDALPQGLRLLLRGVFRTLKLGALFNDLFSASDEFLDGCRCGLARVDRRVDPLRGIALADVVFLQPLLVLTGLGFWRMRRWGLVGGVAVASAAVYFGVLQVAAGESHYVRFRLAIGTAATPEMLLEPENVALTALRNCRPASLRPLHERP